MADPVPGEAMATELVDVALVPVGGKQIAVHPQSLQNARLLGMGDIVSRFAIWAVESETNNVGATVTPSDSKNAQTFKATLQRMWARVIRFNDSTNVPLEFSHPIRFMTLVELQTMKNTPFRQLNYILWRMFQTMLGQEGAKLQTFVDAGGIDEITKVIAEVVEFIDTEIGTGAEIGEDTGKYATGEGMPSLSHIGILKPTPLHGEVTVSEPSSAAPPSIPADTPDVP